MPQIASTLFITISLLFLLLPAPINAKMVNRVVAIVNDDIITLADFNNEGAAIFAKIEQEAPASEKNKILARAQKEILDRLIENKLIEQRADKLRVSVSEDEIDAAIENMLAERHKSKDDYLRELKASGFTQAQHRKRLRNQILQSKLVSYEVRSKIVIPEEKLKEYYEHKYLTAAAPDGLHLLQMGFTWGKQGSTAKTAEEAEKRAQQVHKMVSEGQDFKLLASSMSELPSAKNGGDLGILRLDELAAYTRDAIKDLHAGEISKVIKTPAGFQFFMLVSSKSGKKIEIAPFAVLKEEINDRLYREEMDNRYKNWLKDLRKSAFIKELLDLKKIHRTELDG